MENKIYSILIYNERRNILSTEQPKIDDWFYDNINLTVRQWESDSSSWEELLKNGFRKIVASDFIICLPKVAPTISNSDEIVGIIGAGQQLRKYWTQLSIEELLDTDDYDFDEWIKKYPNGIMI